MKNLGILTLFAVLLFTSCSTSKIVKENEKLFKGDWTLSQITTDQGNLVDVKKIFNHFTKECFEGSQWHLVANNNSGWYTLEGYGCPDAQNRIKWYMQEDGSDVYFWFKQIADDVKDKNVTSGYKMKMVSLSETEAHLMYEVPFEGKKLTMHYYFSKQ